MVVFFQFSNGVLELYSHVYVDQVQSVIPDHLHLVWGTVLITEHKSSSAQRAQNE